MTAIFTLLILIALCACLVIGARKTRAPMGWILLITGLSVFAIRLQHEGPYALPRDGDLRAAALALLLGGALLSNWLGDEVRHPLFTKVALAISPIVFFFASYSTLAEFEEVVVLRATLESGKINDLRLWVVDIDGAAWVTMPRNKANANGLSETRVELLRHGSFHCMNATRVDTFEVVARAHRKRHEKYAIQRFATAIGVFGEVPAENVVALRLEPCA
jgi:hypothetical protein